MVTMLKRTEALYARAAERLPGGNARTTVYVPPHAPYAMRGRGYEVEDVDGRRLIDLQANYTTLVHGHAHPVVTAAALAALQDGACLGLPTPHEVEHAESLAARVPALERLRYANSGTEAVMMAVRAARAFTGRDAVLRFKGCYHGTADVALPPDAPGASRSAEQDLVTVPVGDFGAFEEALERRGNELACVLLDLMPNRAGLKPAEPSFAQAVREATQARGILLVVDEVLTFRLEVGGLHARYGLQPDLITLGKLIGGGFPIGAFGGRSDIMSVFDPAGARPVSHGGTFSANPVSMRAGIAALELLDAAAIARINALGDRLRGRLCAAGYEVAGSGSLFRVLTDDIPNLWWRLYEAGVLLTTNGLGCVSTVMDEAVIDDVVERFERVRYCMDSD